MAGKLFLELFLRYRFPYTFSGQVSIGAVQLWMYLLKWNAVKASFWLFLCPIFGILIAALMLGEPVDEYTVSGVAFVLSGLYIVNRYKTTPVRTATAATD